MKSQKEITEYIQLKINKYNSQFQLNRPSSGETKYPYIDLVYDLQEFCKDLQQEAIKQYSKKISVSERAFEWMCKGEVGASSETILFHFMGMEGFNVDYPYDTSDFRRCYKLLEIFPEWKSEMYQMKKYNFVWANLADEWEKMTELYESNIEDSSLQLSNLLRKCRDKKSDSTGENISDLTDDLSGICE